ncbi:MAG: hypothetical protein ACREIQ_01905 [Nitrospiria bacterium]
MKQSILRNAKMPVFFGKRKKALRSIWILTTLLVFTTFLGCQSEKNKTTLDPALLGTWKTPAPAYSDRFLELTRGLIILGTGEGNVAVHPIKNIEKVHEDEDTLYTLTYVNREGKEYNFSFYYNPRNEGVIRFKNQKQIEWTKERH